MAHSTSTTHSIPPSRSTECRADCIARLRQVALASLVLPALLLAPAVARAREYLQVFVAQPYLELHTGPGRGYPVFHAVPRDASVDVLFRRTEWFKVRTERGVEGWASQAEMLKTVLADGSPFVFSLGDRAGFTSHRGEMGLF
ncbi:MAG: SH3 domain-containing protein, partial [Gammaproteobacteria bacterium]